MWDDERLAIFLICPCHLFCYRILVIGINLFTVCSMADLYSLFFAVLTSLAILSRNRVFPILRKHDECTPHRIIELIYLYCLICQWLVEYACVFSVYIRLLRIASKAPRIRASLLCPKRKIKTLNCMSTYTLVLQPILQFFEFFECTNFRQGREIGRRNEKSARYSTFYILFRRPMWFNVMNLVWQLCWCPCRM